MRQLPLFLSIRVVHIAEYGSSQSHKRAARHRIRKAMTMGGTQRRRRSLAANQTDLARL